MKKLKTLLYGLCAAAMITGCSDDAINNEPGNDPSNGANKGDGVFMALDIEMPNGKYNFSRSQTEDNQYGEGVSSGGVEVGKDYENTVSSALIILAAPQQIGNMPENGFITAAQVRSNRIADLSTSESKQYRAIAGVQKEYLESYYNLCAENGLLNENSTEGPKVNVFVYCNPTADLINAIDEGELYGTTEWLDETCSVIQDQPGIPNRNVGIWGANSFLMNNVSMQTRALPTKISDWDYYNSVENPFRLSSDNEQCGVDNSDEVNPTRGSIRVERSVARFDFRDASPLGSNSYNVLYLVKKDGTTDDKFPVVKVQLTKMCLVNMSNKFYYLPRVSDNGQLNGDNYKLLGRQKPWTATMSGAELSYTGGNYVVGPYAKVFTANAYNENDENSPSGVDKDFTTYFTYPFFEEDGSFNNSEATWERWYVSSIKSVLEGEKDQYEGVENTEGGTYKPGDYRIWRYVTENVIPAPRRSQKNGITTGVVFKGRLHGTSEALAAGDIDDEEYWNKGFIKNIANCLDGGTFTYLGETVTGLQGSSKTDPIFYYFNGRLYMGWRHLRQAAIQASVSFNNVQMTINRSNSLYQAVFGDGPIPNTNRYVDTDGKYVEINDPEWKSTDADWTNSAAYKNYLASADYAWTKWMGSRDKENFDPLDASPDLITMRQTISGQGITIYESSKDEDGVTGYYCYYYYWNRHNDNDKNGTMGPMEFDVVRNNVYKLSVDKISRLGHPRLPDNDPDSPTPDTPDESEQLYLNVRVQIVPWAVRLNSITF